MQAVRCRAGGPLVLALALCIVAVDAVSKSVLRSSDSEPIVPWCRKAAVFAAVPGSPEGAGLDSAVLWSGKAHDKIARTHGSTLVNDLWHLSISADENGVVDRGSFAWRKQTESVNHLPDGRWKSAGDVLAGKLWVFGGDDGHGFLNDLWALPLSGLDQDSNVSWAKPPMSESVVLPPARRGHVLVATPGNQALVVVGGRMRHHICLTDTWVISVPMSDTKEAWQSTQWQELPGIPASCRWGHAAAHVVDPLTNAEIIAVHGGRFKNEQGEMVYHDDLWFLTLGRAQDSTFTGSWSEAPYKDGVKPPARDHHSMVFDKATASLFVFGGRVSESTIPALQDLWRYSLADFCWHELKPHTFLPETRYVHSAVFVNGLMVVFGGEHFKKDQIFRNDYKLNDVWAFSPKKESWTQLTISSCNGYINNQIVQKPTTRITLLLFVVGLLLAWLLGLANRWQAQGGVHIFNYCMGTRQRPQQRPDQRAVFKVEYSPLRS